VGKAKHNLFFFCLSHLPPTLGLLYVLLSPPFPLSLGFAFLAPCKSYTRSSSYVPVIALTATAIDRVRDDICDNLFMQNVYREIDTFHRPNLNFAVLHSKLKKSNYYADFKRFLPLGDVPDKSPSTIFDAFKPATNTVEESQAQAQAKTSNILADNSPGIRTAKKAVTLASGIINTRKVAEGVTLVYCPTRKETENLAEWLADKGLVCEGYHAGMNAKKLQAIHKNFVTDTYDVVVATCAFGMGVDKPDVRNVIHYGLPQCLEQYHQEAGRGGRDGRPTNCVLFHNFAARPSLFPGKRTEEQHLFAKAALKRLEEYCLSRECRPRGVLAYFSEHLPGPCGCCDQCRKAQGEFDHFGGLDPPAQEVEVRHEVHLLLRTMAWFRQQGVEPKFSQIPSLIRILSGRGKYHTKCPCFGLLSSYEQRHPLRSKHFLKGVGALMKVHGLIEDDNPPTISSAGHTFLQNPPSTFIVVPNEQMLLKPEKRARRARGGSSSSWGKEWADPKVRAERLGHLGKEGGGINKGGGRGGESGTTSFSAGSLSDLRSRYISHDYSKSGGKGQRGKRGKASNKKRKRELPDFF
jgi:Werner syndrome ATP-dependent helicase